jgi:Tfp pilus assembly protein PilF
MRPTQRPALSCSEKSVSHLRGFLFASLSLTLLISLIYSNSLDCSWHFDDASNITANPNIHLNDFSWESVKKTFYSELLNSEKLYRPISCFTFALNYYIGGLEVLGYHLVNCGIHILAAIFLFLFTYQALQLPKLEARYGAKSYFLALLATALWAIHPIQTQAVTYIVQRMASLAGMFYIMSMYFYVKARVADGGWRRLLLFILCLITFGMALGAKENAVLLPLSLFSLEVLLIQEKPGLWLRKRAWKIFGVLAIFFTLGIALLYAGTVNLSSFLSGYDHRPFSLSQRLLTEARVIVFYMSLLLYPISNRFSIAHSFQVSTSLFSPLSTLISILFILALLVMLFLLAKKHPLISFSILFFFLNHLIESTILPLEIVFEHRNYIPSMFFFLPWAIGLCRLLDIYSSNRRMAQVFTTFTVIVLVALGHATYLRNFIWKSDWTLWADAAQKAPDQYRVHHNLGVFYRERGYWKEAMHEFQGALACKEFHVKGETLPTHFQLAKLFEDLGDYEKARFHYENVLRINPAYPQALGNLASIYDREGQRAKADEYLLRAMKADPNNPYVNLNMGLYWLRNRNPEEAFKHFKKAQKDKDLIQPSKRYLGISLKQIGRLGAASIYLNESVKLNSNDVIARLHLLEIFIRSGDAARAKGAATELMGSMVRNQRLLTQTLAALSNQRESAEATLDKTTILPPLLQACDSESERLGEIKGLLKTIAK